MAFQFSTTVRNARLDVIETTIGTGPSLYLFSDPEPINCDQADPAGLLATLALPSDWLTTAASGVKTIANAPWTGSFSANGVVASFRVKDSGGTVHIQGSVGVGTGDLRLDDTTATLGGPVNVLSFNLTDGNA